MHFRLFYHQQGHSDHEGFDTIDYIYLLLKVNTIYPIVSVAQRCTDRITVVKKNSLPNKVNNFDVLFCTKFLSAL